MNPEDLAKELNGLEYPFRPTKEIIKKATENNLVIVFGASDDLMEFIGAITDEVGVYEGDTAYIYKSGVLGSRDDLDTDDAVDILQDLEEKDREVVIKQLPSSDRILVEEALSFPEQSAGRLMQREFLAFPSNWTVGQTIDHMRTKPLHEEETFYSIYIVDPAHRLLGVISLSKLLSTKRPVRLKDLMEKEPRSVSIETDQEEVALLFQQYGLVNMPVIDQLNRLLGVIVVDDIVDVINEEAQEDLLGLAGVSDLSLIHI